MFKKFGKTHLLYTHLPPLKTSTTDYFTTPLNPKITCTNVQKTLNQTANTADSPKTIYTYLQNVQEYPKCGNTTNHF